MPSSFTKPLRLELNDDGSFITTEDFFYAMGREGSQLIIRVPKGSSTDFASVPKILHWLIGSIERHGKAAILHDHLYRTQYCCRVVADAVFLEAMGVSGVSRWKRWAMYLGVRIFGWWAWWQNKKTLDAARALAV